MINSHPVKSPRAIFGQLDLFAKMPTGRDTHANTIDLWDFAPLWFQQQPKGSPLSVEREFREADTRQMFIADIRPAHLIEGKKEVRQYPGQREMVIYETLQMLVANGAGGVAQDLMHVTCTFTIGGLRKTLKRYGHEYTSRDIRKALDVLRNSSVTLRVIGQDGDGGFAQSNYLPWLAGQSHEDWQSASPKTVLQTALHPLVAAAIRQRAYRPYDFETSMLMPNGAARYFYRRMCARYKQAPKPHNMNEDNAYRLGIFDLARDSGFFSVGLDSEDPAIRKRAEKNAVFRWREVLRSLGPKSDRRVAENEAAAKRANQVPWLLMNIKYHPATGSKQPQISVHGSPLFVQQQIANNQHARELEEQSNDSRQIKLPIP